MAIRQNPVPIKVSPIFVDRLKELQKKIRKNTGDNKSIRIITEEIVSSAMFEDIERQILKSGDIHLDVKIKFDKRLFK